MPIRQCFLSALFIATVLSSDARCADQPAGEYVLGGRGAIVVTFDGAGNFSGIAAIQDFGVVNMSGTAPVDDKSAVAGTFAFTNRTTGDQIYSGTLTGSTNVTLTVLTIKLSTNPPLSFKGGPRTGAEPVPGGQYFGTYLPTSLLFQCNRSSNRQVLTIQGDQDFGLDLTQAVAGQLVFDQNGNGFGVVYENGSSLNPPRWATASYFPSRDKLSMTFYSSLQGGQFKKVNLAGTLSGGRYDGVYTAVLLPGTGADTVTVSAKVTVKNGVLTGSDTNFGNITGTISDQGALLFTSDKLTVPSGSSQAGAHNATVTYNGTPASNPVFPTVLQGTFAGTNVSGTFVLQQTGGVTGATTPGTASRTDSWSGKMTGTHDSPLSAGGVFNEQFNLSLSFASSLISALRGKSQLLTGSGSMTGSETVKTQSPFPTSISMIVATTNAGGSVNVTFAGVLNGPGPSIEFDSSSALIPGQVHIGNGVGPNQNTDQFENRKIIKLRITSMTATLIRGKWEDGDFFLRKQ